MRIGLHAPPAPNVFEWNFQGLPDNEVVHCAVYEFFRASAEITNLVAAWRDHQRREGESDGAAMLAKFGIVAISPEFPKTPWRDIPPGQRRARITEYTKFALAAETAALPRSFQVLRPEKSQQLFHALVARVNAAKEFTIQTKTGTELKTWDWAGLTAGGIQEVFCRINFDQPTTKIVRQFEQWIRAAKKQQEERRKASAKSLNESRTKRQIIAIAGKIGFDELLRSVGKPAADRTVKSSRERLKALGALRLTKHFKNAGLSQEQAFKMAIEHTEKAIGTCLYSDRRAWLRAIRSAKQFLDSVDQWGVTAGAPPL